MAAVRFTVRALAAIALLLLAVLVTLIIQGHGIATQNIAHPVPTLFVAPDTSLIARGHHLVEVNCSGCHAPGALGGGDTLSGGTVNFLAIPNGPVLGAIYAPNLTPAGVMRRASDGLVSRAIREGISFEGQPLIVMPSPRFHGLSDLDLAAVISYLRRQPPVDHEVPKRMINPLGFLVLGLHKAETSVTNPIPNPIADMPADSTSAYGAYLTPILGCSDCHGREYRGGVEGQLAPRGPDLVAFAQRGPYERFELALRHGVKSTGGVLNPEAMPWTTFARLQDVEVRAVYAYLRSPSH